MRVARIVLGLFVSVTASLATTANAREAQSSFANSRTAGLVESTAVPQRVAQLSAVDVSPTTMVHSYDVNTLMGYAPATRPPLLPRAGREERYHPAQIPLPATQTREDHLLTGFVAVMLIAYQLRRKHRFLRPHRFGI